MVDESGRRRPEGADRRAALEHLDGGGGHHHRGKSSPWPPAEAIAPLVNNDQQFLLLYKELYYRHIYSKLQPTLEQRIEKKRQELRDRGVKGTPVTPETFKAWKERKAKKLLAEKMALQKAETLKKKGKSVLTGRDLYLVQKDVFVDDADAAGDYTRQVITEEGDELYDENGALIEDERPVSVDGVQVDAALYGDDDDLDDLDDLDDD